MDSELNDYRAFERIVKLMHLLGGLWPRVEDTCRLYRLVTCFSIFVIGSVAAKVFGFAVENAGDVLVFVRSMGIVLSSCTGLIKIACCLAYRSDLLILHEELGGKFNEELRAGEENKSLLLRGVPAFLRFTRLFLTASAFTLVFIAIPPLFVYLKHKKFVQIYQGRYPFEVKPGGGLYWLICLLESSSVPVVLFVLSVDCAFGLHCFRLCGLLRLAASRIRDLSAGRRSSELPWLVNSQKLVVRSRDALQRAYGPIILWSNVSNAVIMCSILYQMNQENNGRSVARLIFYLSYIALKLLQSFTYAHYGSLVSQESEKCQNAVYESNWAGSGDAELTRDVLILQTQRPIVVKACGFFAVTMSMFIKILNTTVSYFCLLRTIEE